MRRPGMAIGFVFGLLIIISISCIAGSKLQTPQGNIKMLARQFPQNVLKLAQDQLMIIQFGIRKKDNYKVIETEPFSCPFSTEIAIQAVDGKFNHWEIFDQSDQVLNSIENPLRKCVTSNLKMVAVFE